MTTAIKRRRGTTTQHSTFTGLEGEITVDSTKDTVVVHDGATAGGYPLLREDLSNNTNVITATNTKTLTNKTVDLASNTLTGTTAQFNAALSDNDFATLTGTETLSNKTFSTNPTISSGTANGVAYLNGSKVLTTGSALTFDGANLYAVGKLGLGATTSPAQAIHVSYAGNAFAEFQSTAAGKTAYFGVDGTGPAIQSGASEPITFTTGGSEQMRLTSTGLGIGTSSPAAKLDISGVSRMAFYVSGSDTEYRSVNAAGSAFAKQTYNALSYDWGLSNGFGKMRLDSSGNLGLGVTPSAWTNSFGVIQGLGGWSISHNGANSNSVDFLSNAYRSGGANTYLYVANSNATRYQQVAGSHAWHTAPSGTAGNAISFTQAMTLDASGNLGIGTSSPISRLSISGNFDCDGIGYFNNLVTRNGTFVNIAATTYIAALVAGSERMRIDSGGNLLVGTTSASFSALICNNGNYSQNGNQVNFNSGNSTIEFVNRNSGGSKTYSWYYAASGGGTPATLSTSGVWTNSSDARGKENITDIEYGLQTTLQIKPRQFDVKSDGSHAVGFVAQEIKEVIPEVVHITCTKDGDDYYGVDYGSITAVLVKAIQELKAELDATKAEVAALKGV